MMSIVRPLAIRALTLIGVLLAVLVLLVVTLGATGYSNRLLDAQVSEEVRALRISLAQTIRDPVQLENTIQQRRVALEQFYGRDQPWYTRLPAAVWRVLRLDLGDARSLRTTEGSNRIS